MPGARREPPFTSLGIVGLGLIGGSIARAARAQWPDIAIAAVDRPDVIAAALDRGVITHARHTAQDLLEDDLVVLATPIPVIFEWLDAIGRTGTRAVVTDVGSTKRAILQEARRAGVTRFVGGHPMAGAARGGFEHARPDLFEGQPWLIVPDEASQTPATGSAHATDVARVTEFAGALGGVTAQMTAATHDRLVAFVSHVPQLLAVALMATAGEATGDAGLAAAGPAFREMTRLASSPPDLWAGILASNADFVAEALTALQSALPREAAQLADGRWVDAVFRDAQAWRDWLIHSHPRTE